MPETTRITCSHRKLLFLFVGIRVKSHNGKKMEYRNKIVLEKTDRAWARVR